MHGAGHKRSYSEFNNHSGYNNNHNNSHGYNEEPAAKLQRITNLENNNDGSLLTSISAPSQDQKMIAQHYGNRMDGQLEDRDKSTIIQLRKINNWIKSVLINHFCHQNQLY